MERANNCNDIRLIAAVLVVFSHSFMLASGSNDHEPMFWLSHGQVTIGGLSVFTFFVLSGYLITRSFERTESVAVFATARAVRILPALAIVLFVTAYLLGPWLTKLPIDLYLHRTEPLHYVVKNLSLVTYVDNLPGILQDNPFPGTVNGSLWTLHIEAACYALAMALGVTRRYGPLLTAGVFAGGVLWTMIATTIIYPVLLMTCFTAGAMLHHWPMPRSRGVAAACAAALIVSVFAGGFVSVFATAGAYLVWYAAFAPPWRKDGLTGPNDLSYGTYIWAFPIQQTVVHYLGGGATWYAQVLIALPIILLFAWLSWTLVERRALGWKSRMRAQTGLYAVKP